MRIVCGTDLLPKSDAAIDRAGSLADLLAADLSLIHVVPTDHSAEGLEERVQMALTQVTARMRPPKWTAQCTPNVGVLFGDPARLVLNAVEQTKARLLVLGPHHRRPFRDILDGTMVEKAIVSRKCPVLIVRDARPKNYRRVLLALDDSAASVSAVSAAAALVLTPATTARVIHVQEPPYAGIPDQHVEDLAEDAANAVRNLLGRERAHLADIDIRVERGAPVGGILRSIEEYQPDLLVMGTRAMGRMRRAMLGSVASQVLHEAQRDVLMVPQGSFVAPVAERWTAGRRPIGATNSKGRAARLG
jgi:universal stress protein E